MLGYCFEKSVRTSFSRRSSSGDDDQPIRRRLPDGTAPAGLVAAPWVAPAAGAFVAAGADVAGVVCDCVGPHAPTTTAAVIRIVSQRVVRIGWILPGPQATLPADACVQCITDPAATGVNQARKAGGACEASRARVVGLAGCAAWASSG